MLHISFVFIAAILLAAISPALTDKTRIELASFIAFYLPVYITIELVQFYFFN